MREMTKNCVSVKEQYGREVAEYCKFYQDVVDGVSVVGIGFVNLDAFFYCYY
jgi:hypothetical protein